MCSVSERYVCIITAALHICCNFRRKMCAHEHGSGYIVVKTLSNAVFLSPYLSGK